MIIQNHVEEGFLQTLISQAVFSSCMQYRYVLMRQWDVDKPFAVFILMNPSTADAFKNDPTVARIQVRCLADPTLGGYVILNVFAYMETDSKALKGHWACGIDIIGPENDKYIRQYATGAARVICGWGKPGALLSRDKAVLALLHSLGVQPMCYAKNKDQTPMHPLYVPRGNQPVGYVII